MDQEITIRTHGIVTGPLTGGIYMIKRWSIQIEFWQFVSVSIGYSHQHIRSNSNKKNIRWVVM